MIQTDRKKHGTGVFPRDARHSATIIFCAKDDRFEKVAEHIGLRTGYFVSTAHDGEEAIWILRKLLSRSTLGRMVLVTEFSLPGRSGVDLCRFVRSQARLSDTSILIVSEEEDPQKCIEGLEAGADDFLREPVSLREIESRIGALLRRSERKEKKGGPWSFDRIEIDGLVVDTTRFEVRLHGTPVHLSHKEFTILALFVSRPGRAVPYDEFLDFVWGEHADRSRENLKVHIHALRKKLAGAAYIEAIRGFGYRMRDTSPAP